MGIGLIVGLFLLLVIVIMILSSIKIVNTGSFICSRKIWTIS